MLICSMGFYEFRRGKPIRCCFDELLRGLYVFNAHMLFVLQRLVWLNKSSFARKKAFIDSLLLNSALILPFFPLSLYLITS